MNKEISVNFGKNGEEFILDVKDNGIEFPKELDFKNTDSLVLQLVKNLVQQIDGKIEPKNDHGTEFKIKFVEMKYKN